MERTFELEEQIYKINNEIEINKEELESLLEKINILEEQLIRKSKEPTTNKLRNASSDVLQEFVYKLSMTSSYEDRHDSLITLLKKNVVKQIEEAVINIEKSRLESLDAPSGASVNTSILHVTKLFSVDPKDKDDDSKNKCLVFVSPSLKLKDIVDQLCVYWAIDPAHRHLYSLVDEGGATWPTNINAMEHICAGTEKMNLNFVRVPVFSAEDLNTLGTVNDVSESNAPILGEYFTRETDIGDDPNAIEIQHHKSHSRLRAFLEAIITIVMLITIGAAFEILLFVFPTTLQDVEWTLVGTQYHSGIYINQVIKPFGYDEITTQMQFTQYFYLLMTEISNNDRLVVAMPIRFRQNRVASYPQGSSKCPSFYSNAPVNLSESCLPPFSLSTQAETFYEGDSSAVNPSNVPASSLVFQQNSWSIHDMYSYPPSSSPDIMRFGDYPSSGYIYDMPTELFLNKTIGQDLVLGFTESWQDSATRFFAVEITFYSASASTWVVIMYYYTMNEDGILKAQAQSYTIPAFVPTTTNLASVIIVLVVVGIYIIITLLRLRLGFRAIVDEMNEEYLLVSQEEDLIDIQSTKTSNRNVRVSCRRATGKFLMSFWFWVDIAIILLLIVACTTFGMVYFGSRYRLVSLSNERFVNLHIVGYILRFSHVAFAHAFFLLLMKLYRFIPTSYLSASSHIVYHAAWEMWVIFCMFAYLCLAFIVIHRLALGWGSSSLQGDRLFGSAWSISFFQVIRSFTAPGFFSSNDEPDTPMFVVDTVFVFILTAFVFPLLVATFIAKSYIFESSRGSKGGVSMKSKTNAIGNFIERKRQTAEPLVTFRS